MFAKPIIGSGRFIKMPPSSRLLYYDLGMYADDEGVVEAFTVMRQTGATEDDLRVLVSKGFVKILNDELVTVITDWKVNNFIRTDRYKDSAYHDLLVQMNTDNNQLDTIGIPDDNQRYTEVRLGKDSLVKSNNICSEQSSPHDIPLAGGSYYNVPVQDIGDYKVAYPSTDVEYELRKMKVWCESNPAKLKTRKGIKRFINAWLAKADDLAKEKKPKPVNTDFSDWSR